MRRDATREEKERDDKHLDPNTKRDRHKLDSLAPINITAVE